jgi:hypothetical protein
MKRTALALCLLLCMPSTAWAAAAAASDPEDTKGKLDIVLIEFVQDTDEEPAELSIKTDTKWGCGYLNPAKKTNLKWKFDDSGGNAADYVGTFVCRQGTLVFEISSTDGSQNFEPLPTERPNQKKVVVDVPTDIFDGLDDLWATSKDGEASKCSDPCKDRAPDAGGLFG